MKKQNLAKQTKGITLIALVVTIVVLLILAEVSITAVFGDNGLLKLAKEAGEKTNEAVQKDLSDIQNLSNEVNNIINPPATITEAVKRQYVFRETTTFYAEDGKPIITIPAGFTIIPDGTDSVKYAEPESPTVDDGIVIKDGVGNEFVWVPVPEINDMVSCKTHKDSTITFDEATKKFTCSGQEGEEPTLIGKLYDFGKYDSSQSKFVANNPPTPIEWSDTNYHEPDTVSSDASNFDSVQENGYSDFKTQLHNDFNNLVKSVNKYHGFYIGRYETSGLKDDETPIVQSGKDPTVTTTWYIMYKNSKKIASQNDSVTSSMIWGCQWDAVMNWFLSSSVETTRNYVTDSSGKGVYGEDDKTTTGSKSDYAVNNIYDMAGNVYEWTIEASDVYGRAARGGYCGDSGSDYPASFRRNYNNYPTYNNNLYLGSRATFYVNL